MRKIYPNGTVCRGRPDEVRKAARRKYQREWIAKKRRNSWLPEQALTIQHGRHKGRFAPAPTAEAQL